MVLVRQSIFRRFFASCTARRARAVASVPSVGREASITSGSADNLVQALPMNTLMSVRSTGGLCRAVAAVTVRPRVLIAVLSLMLPTKAGADDTERVIVIEPATTLVIRQSDIPARDAGILTKLNVQPGDAVAEGQVLAHLDDDRQAMAVVAAEVNFRIAQMNAENALPVDVARAQVREAELKKANLEVLATIADLDAQSDIAVRLAEKVRETAQFELERARKARGDFKGSVSNAELNRLQVLFDQRTLEIEKVEEERAIAQLKPEAEKSAVAEQTASVERARLMASQKEQEKRIAEMNLDVARNDLAVTRLQLERRQLVAPFASTIVSVSRQPGEWVEPGTTVFRLIETHRLRVEGFISAEQATRLSKGLAAKIQFLDSSLPPVSGVITFVSPEIDAINQKVRVWADFDNPEGKIRPGLVATMKISLAGSQRADTTSQGQPRVQRTSN